MRVVAGKFKSRILKDFDNSSTRPTLDRVKESIFSKLQFDLDGANVLDLFSGTGALGIEAISRGAENVVFVDKNNIANKLIRDNLTLLKLSINSVYKLDYLNALEQFKLDGRKFDIILLDPPFNMELGNIAIKKILELNLMNENGIIMYEQYFNEPIYEFEKLKMEKIKKYGTVKVSYYHI